MPRIHIASPDGQQQIIEEYQLQAKYEAGTIATGSLYWKEGMANWQPVADLINAAAPAAPAVSTAPVKPVADPNAPFNPYAAPAHEPEAKPATHSPAPGHYAFVKNPRRLTNVLTVLLTLSLVMDVLTLFSDGAQYLLLSRPYTIAEGEANDARQSTIGGIYFLLYLPTVIVFGMWIYRAAVNSRGFGAQGMSDSPGWSVGWYFIPIMNLFRPYQAMKQIWQVSADPHDWDQQSSSSLLVVWWAFWILSNILANMSSFMLKDAATTAALQNGTVISILSSLGSIVLTVVAIALVRTLTRRQEQLVARSNAALS